MSTLISKVTGDFTAAGTWGLVDSTSYSSSEAASTASTTSWVGSQTFVPGAITIDALASKILSHTLLGNVGIRLAKTSGGAITNTLANPTVVTSTDHGLVTGERILVSGSNSTPALVGPYIVTVTGVNTFTVPVNVTVAGTAGTWIEVLATITSNTLVAAPVFTTSVAHGLGIGSTIEIRGSTATPSFNGTWTVATTPATTTFTLTGAPTAVGGVSGQGIFRGTVSSDLTVVCAAADFSTLQGGSNNGWAQMKLAGSVVLNAGTTYRLEVCGTTAANWTNYRTATAGDWSRILRTTTTQAPVAADELLIAGDHTGVGADSSFTVTNDNTATTTWGNTEIADMGKLAYGIAASTNYYYKTANNVTLYAGGELDIGKAGALIPSTSTAKLEFVISVNVGAGLETRVGYIFKTGGTPPTITAKLTADAAAAATALTTDVSTGWLSGDLIALSSTTRTRADTETKALSANAVGTALTIAALTSAHSGTAPIQATLANLTRNVQIFGTSTSLQTYLRFVDGTVDMQGCECFFMGSATANKRGVDLAIVTGTATINNCVFREFIVASSIPLLISALTTGSITISNNIYYNTITGVNLSVAFTGTNYTLNNNYVLFSGSSGYNFADCGGTFTSLYASGCLTSGFIFSEVMTGANTSINGLTSHSNTTIGLNLAGFQGFSNNPRTTFNNVTLWRNNTHGVSMSNSFNFTIDTGTLFGNTTANIGFVASIECSDILLKDLTSNAGVTLTCPIGLAVTWDCWRIAVNGCSFGATTTHATGDISITVVGVTLDMAVNNTTLASATQVANVVANLNGDSSVQLQRINGTNGNHKTLYRYGTIQYDSTIFNTASPSSRMTPNNANLKLSRRGTFFQVASGSTCSPSVWVRKSVVGDGTAYTGNQPRLIVRANPAAGYSSDTVLATGVAANGTWELLSGTTVAALDDTAFEIFVDCDGAAGWVNVDDWAAVIPDPSDVKYWLNGAAAISGLVDPLLKFTDPGIANVRNATAYKFNSTTNNRTGNVVEPTTANVRSGTTFGTLSTLTGLLDLPSINNVRLATIFDSGTKTGNVRIPATTDVRSGVVFDSLDSLTGLLDLPAISNVRLGIIFDNGTKTGNVRIPATSDVRFGTLFDTLDSLTGILNLPSINDVRLSIIFDNGTKTGNVRLPAIADVRFGTLFDSLDSLTGILNLPSINDVRLAIVFDNGTKTGNVRVPVVGDVRFGILFGSLDALTGALDLPSINDVRLAVLFDQLSKTGNVRVPTAAQVQQGVVFDTLDSVTGTFTNAANYTDPGDANVRYPVGYQFNNPVNNKFGRLVVPPPSSVLPTEFYDTDALVHGTLNTRSITGKVLDVPEITGRIKDLAQITGRVTEG